MDSGAFSEASRIFENYATVHTAAKTWLFAMDIEENEKTRLMQILEQYLKDRAIPKTLEGLEVVRKATKSEMFTMEELIEKFNVALEQFTPRELICNVGFVDQGIGLCTDFVKSVGGQRALNLCKIKKGMSKDRVFVLKSSSKTDWFKRRSYGESTRKNAFIIKLKNVEPEMTNIIENKLQELVPDITFEQGNYVEQLNSHFDKLYEQKKEENVKSLQELMQASKGLSKENIKNLTRIAKSPELQMLLQEAVGLDRANVKHLELMAKNFKSGCKSSDFFDSGLTPSPSKKSRTETPAKPRSCTRKLFPGDKQKMFEEESESE